MQGRSLEVQVEAAAGGRPEGLLGVVAEVVVREAATRAGASVRVHGRRATHPWGKGGRGRGPRGVQAVYGLHVQG